MENSFYVYLPSDSSASVYPDNTISQYRTYLPQRLLLDENWKVGLKQLIFPHKAQAANGTSTTGNNIFVYTNIVKASTVGQIKTNILAVTPYNDKGYYEPYTNVYHPVVLNDIHTINILIADQLGKPFKFDILGRCIVVLHFMYDPQ